MKKFVTLVLAVVLALSVMTGCGSNSTEKATLKIYNAGEYIDKSLLTQFEQEFNCKVVYETFDSNESMYTKIMSGETYDILIPSDYMIERLIKENYLAEIDWSKITNSGNLMAQVMDQAAYDPAHTYTVPYFWGSVGIIYDTTVVDAADTEAGWDLLKNTKYAGNIYMYDSERDSLMIALKSLGYSMNTTDTAQIDEAYQWLVDQRDTMDPVYVGDDVIDNMISGNKAMAVVYSGDAAYMMTENENLEYLVPSQGTNIWYDCMVITKNCTQTDLAHSWINFMLDADNALANTEEVGYLSPVQSAYDEMCVSTYEGVSAYTIPDTSNPLNEVFGYQDTETKKYFADVWTKVKAY
ncbi:MAG: ABC transporter substrate-binding protein [Lachnospiraceae bacterium]|nr:ABC transporter substrate-binding protein [Lachnospiraceae bacterium]